ncbi:KPN_02809 family neutral zinc metallopeptidase [Cucumibacter marinus]|uniref:KPN_02809 family neutral zinc metallopeptidase n=1 Tax=Cucumibacter marinus TaxID=1121252 RepID=UPI00040B49A3|nr:neutral zinc metallopeptidase [Cucumibacter marinus]
MKWRGRARSANIEDRRRGSAGWAPGTKRRRVAQGGAGGIVVIVIVIFGAIALGIDPSEILRSQPDLLRDIGGGQATTTGRPAPDAGEEELVDFVGVVLKETETLWSEVFAQNGIDYSAPTLVLIDSRDRSGCGIADPNTGPFYCPADQNIYLDLGFYEQLRARFGAPGDFAQAYVIAHEVGHHIQNLVGTLGDFNQARQSMRPEEANAYSVRVELQADCYAGIWASYAGRENLLERGDIAEALNAAEQIGDDAIQIRTQGYAVPRTFSHGTSEQRQRWFRRGFEAREVAECDTFEVANP